MLSLGWFPDGCTTCSIRLWQKGSKRSAQQSWRRKQNIAEIKVEQIFRFWVLWRHLRVMDSYLCLDLWLQRQFGFIRSSVKLHFAEVVYAVQDSLLSNAMLLVLLCLKKNPTYFCNTARKNHNCLRCSILSGINQMYFSNGRKWFRREGEKKTTHCFQLFSLTLTSTEHTSTKGFLLALFPLGDTAAPLTEFQEMPHYQQILKFPISRWEHC